MQAYSKLTNHEQLGLPLLAEVGRIVTAPVVRRLPVGRLIDNAVRRQRSHARQARGDVESMPPTLSDYLDLLGLPELENPRSQRENGRWAARRLSH